MYFLTGQFDLARPHGWSVAELYDPNFHKTIAQWANYDIKCVVFHWMSPRLWINGYPDQAAAVCDEALDWARHLGHVFNLCSMLTDGSKVYLYRREPGVMLARVDEARTLAREYGLPLFEDLMADAWGAEADLEAGHPETAFTRARDSYDLYASRGGRFCLPRARTVAAQAALACGRPHQALGYADEALRRTVETGEVWYEAESHRVRGTVLLALGEREAAVASLRRAIEVARGQSAKGWELRAATSLATLWAEQGERRKAHDLLFPVYDWFTEGFDTKDLVEAKALLGALEG